MASRMGTGEYLFDAIGQGKDDGLIFGPIGCMWHVARAIAQTLAKKSVAKGAGQTNGQIRLKLGGLMSTMGGLNPFGQGSFHVKSIKKSNDPF